MKPLIIVKTGDFNAESKQKLVDAGYLVIEHENPEEVRVVESFGNFDNSLLLCSAMAAMTSANPKDKFVEEVSKRILKAESENKK